MKPKILILSCFFAVLALSLGKTAVAGTAMLLPVEDAELSQSGPNDTHNNTEILIQSKYYYDLRGENWRGILMFDLSSIPAEAAINGSSLRVYMTDPPPDGSRDWELWFCDNDAWDEEHVTWNTQPATTELLDTISTLAADGYMNWGKNGPNAAIEKLTDKTRTEFEGDKKLTFIIKDASEDYAGNAYAYLRSKEWENSEYHPFLIVDY